MCNLSSRYVHGRGDESVQSLQLLLDVRFSAYTVCGRNVVMVSRCHLVDELMDVLK